MGAENQSTNAITNFVTSPFSNTGIDQCALQNRDELETVFDCHANLYISAEAS